jgi:short-subunit dehydrogenase
MKIFITGGSSGLGKELVLSLSQTRPDCEIFFTFNKSNPSDLTKLKNVKAVQVDFSKSADLAEVLSLIKQGDFDCIINNYHAGYCHQHLSKHSGVDALGSFTTSVAPVIDITNTYASVAKSKTSGQIINILSSVTLSEPVLGMAVYTAEKKYLEELARHWAKELHKFGINVTSVSPKLLKTSFNNHLDSRLLEMLEKQGEFSSMKQVVAMVLEILESPDDYHGKNILA